MKAWYFSNADRRLRYGDDRLIEPGTTHTVTCDLVMCEAGLHASKRIMDALKYAPGPYVWRVELGGDILKDDDKAVATERTYLWGYDATDVLRDFARRCALDVIHLWDAPDVVVEYLETGNEDIRAAARYATRYAARDAAGAAARDAARAAAWAAAGAATGDKQNRRLSAMIVANRKGSQ